MHLSLCSDAPSYTAPEMYFEETTNRPLVVFLSWLMARESHLEKYRQIYFKHGFDVLTVKTSPLELVMPKTGSQVIARNLLDFLKNKVSTYPNVVVHGFSVGAYQFSEMLVLLENGLYGSNGSVDASCEIVKNAIKGMIFDSAVDVDGAPYGVSVSLLGETKAASLLEVLLKFYMKLLYKPVTRHFYTASEVFRNTPLRCPALLLVSNHDKLGHPRSNEIARDRWTELGLDVTWKCWEKSRHVAHFQKYPTEYVDTVDGFLAKLGFVANENEEKSETKKVSSVKDAASSRDR